MNKLLWLEFIVLTLLASISEAGDAPIAYGDGRQIASLASKVITESSGIACGHQNKDIFWTHNDSGGTPQVYAFGLKGEDLGTLTLSGARNQDWEDMASFSHDGRHYLLIADVGDNLVRREHCTLYVVQEPELSAGVDLREKSLPPAQEIRFRYENGPRNCESVAVDPQTRTIILVEKRLASQCTVYSLPWPENSIPIETAKAIATLEIPTTTAMDISPDGLRAVVLTYGDAYEFVREESETWTEGFARPSRRIAMPPRFQGESICYGADGKSLYLTSECKDQDTSRPSPLLEVPVK